MKKTVIKRTTKNKTKTKCKCSRVSSCDTCGWRPIRCKKCYSLSYKKIKELKKKKLNKASKKSKKKTASKLEARGIKI